MACPTCNQSSKSKKAKTGTVNQSIKSSCNAAFTLLKTYGNKQATFYRTNGRFTSSPAEAGIGLKDIVGYNTTLLSIKKHYIVYGAVPTDNKYREVLVVVYLYKAPGSIKITPEVLTMVNKKSPSRCLPKGLIDNYILQKLSPCTGYDKLC